MHPALLLNLALAGPARADEAADTMARAVVEALGDPYREPYLQFTFVVVSDGAETVRRTHRWCPQAGRVEVQTADLATRISAVDGAALAPTTTEQAAAEAWGAFVNDGYWLLAAHKLLDPGVHRALDEQGRLALRFEQVGLTPGDRYAYTIDPQTHRPQRWDFVLQSGREGHFRWEGWITAGGLALSTRRVSDEGSFEIRFEDIAVAAACPL